MKRAVMNNKGAALAMVIMVLVVLIILGTSALGISMSETKLSIASEKNIQAEYIAKSGADIAAQRVIDNPTNLNSIASTPFGNGTFSANITKNSNIVNIESTGVVDGHTKKVSVLLKRQTYSDLFTGIKQTGEGELDLTQMPITYDTGSTVSIEAQDTITLTSANNLDPNIIPSINHDGLPPFEVPDSTGFLTEADIPASKILAGDYIISGTLIGGYTFDTQGSDQQIIVDSISFTSDDVYIIGGGTVHLYINGNGADSQIKTPNTVVNANRDGNLIIYVEPSTTLEFQANSGSFGAYIYGPEAIIHIQSNQTLIAGSIVGDILTKNHIPNGPHGNFHFTPLSNEPDDISIELGYKKELYVK